MNEKNNRDFWTKRGLVEMKIIIHLALMDIISSIWDNEKSQNDFLRKNKTKCEVWNSVPTYNTHSYMLHTYFYL